MFTTNLMVAAPAGRQRLDLKPNKLLCELLEVYLELQMKHHKSVYSVHLTRQLVHRIT